MMISKKIISAILTVAIVGGGTTAAALKLSNTPSHPSNVLSSEVSSIVESSNFAVSSAISSQEVKAVDDGTSAIKKATDDGVSKINSVASQAMQQVPQAANGSSSQVNQQKQPQRPSYDVIDPKTGKHVNYYDTNYQKIKAELGGDAGEVDTNKSIACQKALADFKATQAKQ